MARIQKQTVDLVKAGWMVLVGLALLFIPQVTLLTLVRLLAVFLIVQSTFVGIAILFCRALDRNRSLMIFEMMVSLVIGLLILYKSGTTISFLLYYWPFGRSREDC